MTAETTRAGAARRPARPDRGTALRAASIAFTRGPSGPAIAAAGSRRTDPDLGMAPAPAPHETRRVWLVPFDGRNPYQRELARQLRALGIRATPRRSLRGIAAALARRRDAPDIVHLHWLPRVQADPVGALRVVIFLCRVLWLRAGGIPVVWTVHNLSSHETKCPRAERWLARWVGAAASRIIAHSDMAGDLVARECAVADRQKIAIVPHGHYIRSYPNTIAGPAARRQLGLEADALVLLFFGNIRPYKGVPELVAAFQRVQTPATRLVIAGKATHPTTLSAVSSMIADSPSIHLKTGFIPDEAVQCYMNASDVVVLPYRDVLTSGAAILAMSFGRACVAPAMGCLPDWLDERGAFLYDPADPNGLCDALDRAIRNRERLRSMGVHNLERAREWGWPRIASETADVYAAALGARSVWPVSANT